MSIARCNNCGHVFQSPRLSDNDIIKSYQNKKEFYESLPNKNNMRSLNIINSKRILMIEKFVKGKILDIGCGFGNLLSAARQRGWETYGVEVSSHMANVAKKYGKVKESVIEKAVYPRDFFDAITMFDVLEHVSDPQRTLKACNNILKKGGILVIQTPSSDSVYAKIRGKNWDYFGLQHLNYFSLNDIRSILAKNGFRISKIYYGDEIGTITSAKSRMYNKNNSATSTIKFILIQILRRIHLANISIGSKVYYVTKTHSL